MRRSARLIYNPGAPEEQTYPFAEQIVVGRREADSVGRVQIKDPAISGRHCVVRQDIDGRFFIRDESRNGTRVQGRRLVPNVEVEVHPGDRIQVADAHYLVLEADHADFAPIPPEEETDVGSTRAIMNEETDVTILVGDIRGYTTLNERFAASDVTAPLRKLFVQLEAVVGDHQGTIKEYQGDAIFAFWEADSRDPLWHSQRACQCALALDRKVNQLAADHVAWPLRDFPLGMDWALTTGKVVMTTMGGDRVTGLAMLGDAVNYAFRLEKLANEETGRILACQHTEQNARSTFVFRPLGQVQVKGRSATEPIFSLIGAADEETVTVQQRPDPYDTPLPRAAPFGSTMEFSRPERRDVTGDRTMPPDDET